jgi:hypothetical protein
MEPRCIIKWPKNLLVVNEAGHLRVHYHFDEQQRNLGENFARQVRRLRDDLVVNERLRREATKIKFSPQERLWTAPIESLGVVLWLHDAASIDVIDVILPVDVSHGVGDCARAREIIDFECVEANWRQLIVEEAEGERTSLVIERNSHEGLSPSLNQSTLRRRRTKRLR